MSKIKERSLYKPILELFNPDHDTFAEVYFSRKRVDLVFVEKKEKKIIAVELKVSDWRSALNQAVTNQLFADESYIAFANKKLELSRKAWPWFIKFGVGVILVGKGENKIIIPAIQSKHIIDYHRKAIMKLLDTASLTTKTTLEEFENGIPATPPRTMAFLPAGSY